ncbi:MAG: hybrid sensor histidine kinase/response regulator [Thiomargarita sp.]|nr:hybrid sensor histidine kinase/response regulator [Thiomargarita sp.]
MIDITDSTLLIVDDLPENLGLLFNYLRDLGFKVNVAESGDDAIEQMEYTKPDLIILDIMMPGIDGFETCRRLKKKEDTRNIPIIFMSALSDTVDKVKGFQVGAVDYITKPIQPDEVLARVKAHLMLRKQQQILEQQAVELQQQNSELESFAHTVAHDLKNPLNGVSNMSDMLIANLDNWSTEKMLKPLQIIQMAGDKMLSIINALLLLSSSRSQEVPMQSLNMQEVISQIMETQITPLLNKYQGKLIMPKQWATAIGYSPWIEEVWLNYIINAIKYGGKPPIIEIGSTVQTDNFVKFWVRDNGKGLSLEEQKHLFIPFTRIGQARIDGHGLGLSIVQRIAGRCGGKVGIESQLNQGSTFYFTLPKT